MTVDHVRSKGGVLMATLVTGDADKRVEFVTRPIDQIQVGMMRRPAGDVVLPHYHSGVFRTSQGNFEVFVVKSGRFTVTLHADDDETYHLDVRGGDTLILYGCGHGFQFHEETVMVEVKQGPYVEDKVML